MPKSLVKEALGKDAEELEQKSSPQPAAQVQASPPAPPTADDEEIAKIAAQLDVSIKIIGCGGGGSNTINRCVEAGVSGRGGGASIRAAGAPRCDCAMAIGTGRSGKCRRARDTGHRTGPCRSWGVPLSRRRFGSGGPAGASKWFR